MSVDPKQGERDYYAQLGAEGIEHSLGKPFSDDCCAQYLAAMTAIFNLLAPPPARVVEFGCGTGWLSLFLAQRGYEVLGVDIAREAADLARRAATSRGLRGVEFVASDYENFEGNGRFDYAIFHDALHHAESELAALRCAYTALAPGGCLITLEPGSAHATALTSRDAVARFGVHEKSMPPSHIIAVARQAGFTRHLVLPHPHQHNRLIYRRAYHRVQSRRELAGLRILSFARTLWQLLRWRQDPGLVLLWK
jgi:2-polyprenyl-3-methyl-5-hydroxy-6-metoxy-1,4-benzoquinol methylase